MKENIAISAKIVSKTYQIYEAPLDRIKQGVWRGRKKFFREFEALRNVSFEVAKGETVGVVGRNGSGKSTLLQLICGVLAPTSGEIKIDGRIAALLELGAGFNPEFTGRENVYLNASIMGLSTDEVNEQFDRIAAFADIGTFIDQPVRTYSSGMYVRLAFATAIHVSPDILIVDEALSVGDEAFQRKCYSRIHEIKSNGGTILFVSHAASAVVELCDRAILLDGGEILLSGGPKSVITQYHKLIYAPAENVESIRNSIRELASGEASNVTSTKKVLDFPEADDFYDPYLLPQSSVQYEPLGAIIDAPMISTLSGKRANILRRGEDYIYSYDVCFTEAAALVRCGTMIKTVSGLELGGLMTHPVGQGIEEIAQGSTITPKFKFRCNLMPGVYFMNAGVAGIRNGESVFLHRIVDAVMFRVQPEADLKTSGTVDFSSPET